MAPWLFGSATSGRSLPGTQLNAVKSVNSQLYDARSARARARNDEIGPLRVVFLLCVKNYTGNRGIRKMGKRSER